MKLIKALYESDCGNYRRRVEETNKGKVTIYLQKIEAQPWSYYNRRSLSATSWQKHRTDGPAHILEKPDGTVVEKYYQHNVLHREDGPASYREHGKDKGKPMYRLKGQKVSAYDVLGEDSKEAFAHALQYEDGKTVI